MYLAISHLPAQLERCVQIMQSNGTKFGNVHMVYEPLTWVICLEIELLNDFGIPWNALNCLIIYRLLAILALLCRGKVIIFFFKLVLWGGQ